MIFLGYINFQQITTLNSILRLLLVFLLISFQLNYCYAAEDNKHLLLELSVPPSSSNRFLPLEEPALEETRNSEVIPDLTPPDEYKSSTQSFYSLGEGERHDLNLEHFRISNKDIEMYIISICTYVYIIYVYIYIYI